MLTVLEMLRRKCMVGIAKKREVQAKWTTKLCQNILKKMNKNVELSRECWPIHDGTKEFEVTALHARYVVEIEARTCSCRK